MNSIEHLTRIQLSGYYSGAFAEQDTHEIGRHLLQCTDCRKRLPAPTSDQVWNAILTKREVNQLTAPDASGFSFRKVFSKGTFAPLRLGYSDQSRLLVWGSGALIILLACSFAIWLSIAQTAKRDLEVAQVNSKEKPTIQTGTELGNDQSPVFDVRDLNSNLAANEKPGLDRKGAEASKANPRKGRTGSLAQFDSNRQSIKIPRTERRENVSLTRGATSNCSEENSFAMEFGAISDAMLLKWKAIPNAAKYHLYISDDEEILVAEFETETATSFLLKKALDPAKNYKWKIIVTLENGHTIVGSSLKFTQADIQNNQIKLETNGKTQIRCSAKN